MKFVSATWGFVGKKKKLLLLIFLVLVVAGLAFLILKLTSNNNQKAQIDEGESYSVVDENFIKQQEFIKTKQESTQVVLNKVNNYEEFSKLSQEDQTMIAEQLMEKLYNQKNYTELLKIATYLSDKGGSLAIVAMRYCYNLTSDPNEKTIWRDKIIKEAKLQGIITNDSEITDSYFKIGE